MGETRLLLLSTFLCILLTNQTVQTNCPTVEQTRQEVEDTGQDDSTKENLWINVTVIDDVMFFNWNSKHDTKARYKTQILACNHSSPFTNWDKTQNVEVKVKPFSNVTLEVTLQSKNVTKHTESKCIHIPGKVPFTKVTKIEKNGHMYITNIENPSMCNKYNGNEMKILFVLKESNKPIYSNATNRTVAITNNTASLDYNKENLLAFTNYTVTAFPANNFGSNTSDSVKQEITFTTPPQEPGKVHNLTVTSATSYCLKVEWNGPNDDPPKGILETFEVTSFKRMTTAMTKEIKTNTTLLNTSITITGLDPNTEYNITVKAKNKNKNQYGDPVSVIGNTTEERDPPLFNIMSTNETSKTTLHLSWNPSLMDVKYTVSLESKNKTTETNNITFDSLSAGTRYTVKVKACTKYETCSINETDVWTRPEEPKVKKETKKFLQATDTTITIQLPTLENPPGYHWVLLKKDDRGSDVTNATSDIKDKAKEIVLEKKQIRHKRTVRSIDKEKLRFVKVMEVKGDEKVENTLTVGDGSTEENGPLESGTHFAVVIVTEKRAGNYFQYYVSDPFPCITKRRQEIPMLGIIGGTCVSAMILIAIITLLFIASMKQRRKPFAVNDDQCFNEGDTFINETGCEDDTIPSENGMAGAPMLTEEGVGAEGLHQNNIEEEDVYANVSHEVNREDLQMYLPKAMFSAETTMEFSSVPFFMPGKTASESRVPENVPKNRYRNEISYDDTRVKLPFYNNIPYSDYINANFVQDPLRHKAFIATQGPKDHNADTIGAFWRMIWHTNCSIILMVANLVEGGRVKVAKYWPETEPLVKEGVKVTLTSVRIVMDFAVRTFTMVANNMEREVTQYHYIAWPDHGVPQTAYGLGQMLRAVIQHYGEELHGPITVHCSAGIGRTGTIILTLYLLRQLDAFNAINPRKALQALRMGRGHLVENKEQYIFVHKILQAILFEIKTTYPCNSFVKELAVLRSSKGLDGTLLLQQEFKKIKNLPKDLTFKHGKDSTCAHLNRNQAILPADKRMVFVQKRGEDSQYLNIIRINGFDKKDAYLAGEHPQSTTLAKVWCLVLEWKVPVWLMLQEFPHNNPLFPDVVSKSSPLPQYMTLEVSKPRNLENFTEYSVSITVKGRGGIASHKCTLLMLKGWSYAAKLPSSPTALLGAIEKAESLLSLENPLLFTCSDGVSGCGVTAALLLAVSRAKLTQEVDIYHSTVSVQYDRPQFILDFEQYQFLYTAMEAFLEGNKHYGNFV